MLISLAAGIPTAIMGSGTSFWSSIFVSSILGVVGISVVYVSGAQGLNLMAAVWRTHPAVAHATERPERFHDGVCSTSSKVHGRRAHQHGVPAW
jgi:hypothetical protein